MSKSKWRVLSQNGLSAIFDIFKVRATSYNTKSYFLIIDKGIILKLWSKVLHIILLFSLYFNSLNLKYLKFTKMDITRFAMKLFNLGTTNACKCSGWRNSLKTQPCRSAGWPTYIWGGFDNPFPTEVLQAMALCVGENLEQDDRWKLWPCKPVRNKI